jgi:hypothetical protein
MFAKLFHIAICNNPIDNSGQIQINGDLPEEGRSE